MKVKLFKTTTCPYCKMEAEYLTSKGVQFEEIYVDRDPNAATEMMNLTGQLGVPVTLVIKDDGSKESLLGFEKDKLNKILGIS
jgi:glutaredoxin